MGNIYIETPQGNLDIKEGFGFGVNISVADLLDVSKKNTPYTKTILLDGTKTNNQILGSLFDVNSDFTFFNPNFKIDAKIVVNGTTVISGFLQLLEVKKLNTNDLQGNNIQYSVKISDNVIDFYSAIKDKELTDLDFSDEDHILTRANIEASWTNTSDDVYTYPLMYWGSNIYQTADFKPAIFHKAYLEKIFEDAQYSIGGTFFDNNTDYAKEIIPFNRQSLVIDSTELTRRSYQVGTTGVTEATVNITDGANGDISLAGTSTALDNDSTGGNFDNAGVWNTALNKWTADRNGRYNLEGDIGFEVEWDSGGLDAYMFGYVWNGTSELNQTINWTNSNYKVILVMFKNGVAIYNFATVFDSVAQSTGSNITFNAGNAWNIVQDKQVHINYGGLLLQSGDEITFKYRIVPNTDIKYCATTSPTSTNVPVTVNLKVNDNNVTTKLFNTPLGGILTDDDTVNLNSFIPAEIKQSDLIDDIVKRYNLVIRTDEDNNRKLLFDSKDDYYNAGSTIDWTDKKDYSNEDSIQFLADLQNKEMLFSYKEDDDQKNTYYTDSIDGEEIYGQKKIEFDNQFVKGTKKVESIFSPTPLVYSSPSKEMILPSITTSNDDINIRVLYYGGLINTLNSNTWVLNSVDSGTPTTTSYSTYPYCGHFDNPITPTLDINFGLSSYYFYNELTTSPNNNLYNNYWRNTVNQIAEGKLVTSKFHLTEVDVSYLRFNLNARIFIKDSYYHINKIVDYNPLDNGLTKVELIKIIPTTQFSLDQTETDVPTSNDATFRLDTSGNQDNSSDSTIVGRNNYIGIGSYGSIVTGSNNTIGNNSPNSIISGGDNNLIASGLENVTIIGSSNQTVSTSNTAIINGVTISEGGIISKGDTQTVTANYKVLSTDYRIYLDSSGGAFTVTLEDTPLTNREIEIIDKVGSCGSYNVTVDGGTTNIIGNATALMNSNYIAFVLVYNGTQWNLK